MSVAMVFATAVAVSGAQTPDGDSVEHARSSHRIRWTSCDEPGLEGLDCGTIKVPLDYDRRNGRMIKVRMARLPAGNQADKLGTIFLNPGGPGGSGIDFVAGAGPFLYTPTRCVPTTT